MPLLELRGYSPQIIAQIEQIPIEKRVREIADIQKSIIPTTMRRQINQNGETTEIWGVYKLGLPLIFRAWRTGFTREIFYLRHNDGEELKHFYTKWMVHKPYFPLDFTPSIGTSPFSIEEIEALTVSAGGDPKQLYRKLDVQKVLDGFKTRFAKKRADFDEIIEYYDKNPLFRLKASAAISDYCNKIG